MKKYDVYGLGNALVDMEFPIKDQFLQAEQMPKGQMSLISEERQKELLQKLGQPSKRSSGGSAGNTVVGLAQLGGRSFYSCLVADDELGRFFVDDLKAYGVDSTMEHERPTGTTGVCFVLTTPDTERTMNTHLGITQNLSAEQLDPQALSDSEYLFIEGYTACNEASKQAAITSYQLAQQKGVKVALTFSDPAVVENFRSNFLDILGERPIDVLFCNEEEAKLMGQTKNWTAAVPLLKKHAQTLVLTRGGQGSVIFTADQEYEIAASETQAVDANGAGDAYAGAFLYGLTQNLGWERTGKLASYFAAQVVSKFGPRLELDQVNSIKEKLQRGEL